MTEEASEAAQQQQQAYLDALDEVHTRFVLNVPDSELERADRILFQIEQAWWFYEDFMVDASRPQLLSEVATTEAGVTPLLGDPLLPSMNFRQFAERLFEYSPLLDTSKFPAMWAQFSAYRKKIGTYGCILLSSDRRHVILVQLWNSKTHMFPSGKINQGESAVEAAIRETYEETGFDVSCRQGLTAEWKETMPERITWPIQLPDSSAISFQEDSGKRRTCYVVPNVPSDFPFGAIARKEVSKIAWHPLDSIPRPSFAVVPFLSQLKAWIRGTTGGGGIANAKGRKSTPKRDGSNPKSSQQRNNSASSSSRGKSGTPGRNRPRSRSSSHGNSNDDNDIDRLVASGLAEVGDDCRGWSEEDMFRTNEKMLGRKVTYDGNPHAFATSADDPQADRVDPHMFRVVGGTFLNAPSTEVEGGIRSLAPAPDSSRLQPLFRTPTEDDEDAEPEFQPFFSDDGVTPWGEVVKDAQGDPRQSRRPTTQSSTLPASDPIPQGSGQDLFRLLHPQQAAPTPTTACRSKGTSRSRKNAPADKMLLPTDAQITARSQKEKTESHQPIRGGGDDSAAKRGGEIAPKDASARIRPSAVRDRIMAQYEADMAYIHEWVSKLPRPPPSTTSPSGKPFALDADAIMAQLDPIFFPKDPAVVTTNKRQ